MPGFPKTLPKNSGTDITLSLADASPLSSRNTVLASSIGEETYQRSYVIGVPNDDAYLNGLMTRRRVYFGSTHVENVDQLLAAILAT